MKKYYFILMIAIYANQSQGQTLNSSHFPSPGDIYKYFYTDTLGIVAGSAGSAQIWNFEDLNVDTVLQTDNYVAPIVTTPPVTGHSVAQGDTLNGYNFFNNTATEYSMLGFSDSANVNVVAYSNPMTLLTFPFSYGNTNTDNFAFTATFQGNAVNATGTINSSADGSGNLLLPQGAFNNVLRVKYNVVTNITVSIFNITQTQNIYEWYDGINKFPLLHIEQVTTTDPFGGAPTVDKLVWVEATGPAGIKNYTNKNDFSLSPNPAQDIVNLKFNQSNRNKTEVIIFNALGQIVYENNNVDAQLSNLNISVADLEKGVYFVKVNQNNNTFTKKLVVQ
ncbi:MAG TPA: T9SS type A sorting domain-containing protein [Bacteroidia bacterium]|nr:T9SS type A sorting domain-containing protein [Bacteroidia bacterium]